ncbi:MAG TPA: hypothetical protein VK524_12820 [Polyangiaceae bacterium]|nr:hypothetical protein [Polyangiaceae bacterium]
MSACSDDGTTYAPSANQPRPDAAGDAASASDASSDAAASDSSDAAVLDTDGAAEDAGTDASIDDASDAGIDGGDAGLLDARDSAADVARHCATLDCDDDIDCTVDDCDESLGCTHTPSNALCNDNKVCSGSETCNPATGCQPGTPLVCGDSNRCTFDYCSEPAAGCVHHDVSTSVELLLNANFDYGENLAWRQFPLFSDGSLIWENADLADTPDWFAWLGGQSNISMRVWQAVEVPAATAELTLSGVYALIPGSGAPALSSYFRIDVGDALTGADYERALSLSSTQSTTLEWMPFSLTTREAHAGKVLQITISSQNAVNDLTNYWVDTLSLRAKLCPLE